MGPFYRWRAEALRPMHSRFYAGNSESLDLISPPAAEVTRSFFLFQYVALLYASTSIIRRGSETSQVELNEKPNRVRRLFRNWALPNCFCVSLVSPVRFFFVE